MHSAFHAFTWANNLLSGVVFLENIPKEDAKRRREGAL